MLEAVVSNRLRVLRWACGALSCWGTSLVALFSPATWEFLSFLSLPLFPFLPLSSLPAFLSQTFNVLCGASLLSCVHLILTPWTVARHAPLSMGILQASILEQAAIPPSRASSQPREYIVVSHVAGFIYLFIYLFILLSEPPGKSLEWAASDPIVFISVRSNGVYLRISMSLLTFRTHKTQLFQVS